MVPTGIFRGSHLNLRNKEDAKEEPDEEKVQEKKVRGPDA